MSSTPNIDRVLQQDKHNDGLFFTTVEVARTTQLTPRMKRVVVVGEGLGGFHLPCANVAVRLFFPESGQELETIAPQTDIPAQARTLRTRARVYTARSFDRENGELAIDFVLHEEGVASNWAANAQIGDRILLSGPRSHAVPPQDSTHLLLTADESALAALETVLESLPESQVGEVFVSIATPKEIRPLPTGPGLVVTWVDRSSAGGSLVGAVAGWRERICDVGSNPAAWLAGELYETREVRQLLRADADYGLERIQSFPYWRRGSDATTLDEDRSAAAMKALEAGKDFDSVDDLELV